MHFSLALGCKANLSTDAWHMIHDCIGLESPLSTPGRVEEGLVHRRAANAYNLFDGSHEKHKLFFEVRLDFE